MNNNLAENLKRIRKEHNLSQEQLAYDLGVSRQAISKWESSIAYPEMDKILAICEKFNLNIDDLLHKDIKDVQKEKERERNLNKYLDDFLKFITDTIDLFSMLRFKDKLKCLIEQIIIFLVLLFTSAMILNISAYIFKDIFSFLPLNIYKPVMKIGYNILLLLLVVLSLIIFVHIFKTRYLDYYQNSKDNKTLDTEKEKQPINIKEKEKVIIRDPKHSEYHFINGLYHFILGVIKFLSLWFILGLIFILVTILTCLVMSFLLYKTGLLFLGLIGAFLSLGIMTYILLLMFINFIFNRPNNKKVMIYTFLSSIVFFGLSLGLILIGTLDFKIIENMTDYKMNSMTYSMQDDFFIYTYNSFIKYVEEDIDYIRIETKVDRNCELKVEEYSNELFLSSYCENPLALIKDAINDLNHKRIKTYPRDAVDIKVYTSKENIQKLQDNLYEYITQE